jgi:membrane associated rhomboid family serine protease
MNELRPSANHSIAQEIKGVVAFVGVIWAVYFIGLVSPLNLNHYGLTPRTAIGLVGIPAMPFLHANLQHLISNTVPLVVLLILLAGSRARSWEVVVEVVLLGGGLLWLFGRTATHVGASGLISGLITFLIVSGLRERRIVPLFVALCVGFLYGGTLLAGIVPHLRSNVSWDGHLCGAVAGVIVAYALTGKSRAIADTSR